jgi:putative glycosyltransferase (TIGR04372 family)
MHLLKLPLSRVLIWIETAWGVFLSLLLICLRPLRDIRVYELGSQRIGHLALEPELWLSRRDVEAQSPILAFFFAPKPVCNAFLLRAWARSITLVPTWIARPVYLAGLRFPRLKVVLPDWYKEHADLRVLDATLPHLLLTTEERSAARQYLSQMGVPEGMPYVCLAVRDRAYLSATQTGKDWTYHDYRDSDIGDYIPMANFLALHGYAVIRMGSIVEKAFEADNPLVLDYANSKHRSDLLDVSLFASCAFCISTSTGMDSLALIFRRPVGVVNVPGAGGIRLGSTTQLLMPKDVYDIGSGKKLSLLDPKWLESMSFTRTGAFLEAGLDLRSNSPQELVDFAREMIALTEGRFDVSEEHLTLERQILAGISGDVDRSLVTAHFAPSWLTGRVREVS